MGEQMLHEAITGGGGLGGDPQLLEQMLPQLLPEIEQSDPEMAQRIRENPQLLIQMLQAAAAADGGGDMEDVRPNVVHLTEDENAAVERLAELGFEKNEAASAYLACQRNEELAANFLFESDRGTM